MLQWDAVRLTWRQPIALPRVRPVWLAWEAYKKFLADGAPDLAATIAYSALFSIFPLLIAVVAAVGLFIDQALVRSAIFDTLSRYVPEST
ncbi:MAG TPA: YhjD/YihY/BrkB family envelope integrity protein, partial [bacterium]|nr:YhjD/YihY/BrkB family envelope integrity protein [bacterium]